MRVLFAEVIYIQSLVNEKRTLPRFWGMKLLEMSKQLAPHRDLILRAPKLKKEIDLPRRFVLVVAIATDVRNQSRKNAVN